MLINDRIYGEVEINEPVLLELMESKPMQRLKKINQAGATTYILPGRDISRFEHSVGVMILLKKLGASVEEQIAGLLHDVPHTAFSHVADFVFRRKKHDYHEIHHEKIIMESEIPKIMKKYGFDVKRMLDEHNFPLLERDSPDLCADRVDYAMRDGAIYLSLKNYPKYIKHLIVHDNEIIFNDKDAAIEFGKDFLYTEKNTWASPKEIVYYVILADAINAAFDKGILTEDDLFEDDNYVYQKLKNCDDEDVLKHFRMINPKLEIVEDKENYQYHPNTKGRVVDPKFIDKDGKIRRASEFDEALRIGNQEHLEEVKSGYYMRVVSY